MSLTQQFRERTIQKTYLALCHGVPEVSQGTISESILRVDEDRTNKPKVVISPRGDRAESRYRVCESCQVDGQMYSVVQVQPKTGRMHQIRIHMSHIGFPLVGDKRYGGKRPPVSLPESVSKVFHVDHRGHFLHAQALEFTHPRTGERVVISI